MRNTFLFGVGVGATLMYFFDPSWGRRRRAQFLEGWERASGRVEAARARRDDRFPGTDEYDDDDFTRDDELGGPRVADSGMHVV